MKYLKTFGLAAGAVAVLMAFAGAGTAAATVLCKNNESTSICNENYSSETEITSSLVSGTKAKLKTSFKNVECSKATVSGRTENGGSATETVKVLVEALTFEECNCTVSVLKKGTLELHWISGGNNATVTGTGAEVTVTCSTIFGTVHCIYATEGTDLGTLTGGSPAKLELNASVPRLTTNALCSEEATWEASYEVSSPKPLYATEVAKLTVVPDPVKFGEEGEIKEATIKNTGTVTINKISIGIKNPKDFFSPFFCGEITLAKGESCLEGIRCLTKNKSSKLLAISTEPLVIIETTLKC